MTSLADRLQLALSQKPGATQADLARACGVKPPSVSDWFTGATKSLKARPLRLAAQFLGVRPEWLETGQEPMRSSFVYDIPVAFSRSDPESAPRLSRAPTLDQGVAHRMIHGVRDTPPRLYWGDVKNMNNLPREFELELSDNAMANAPVPCPQGTVCTFRATAQAQAGEALLVRDKRGEIYFRECRYTAAGGWVAFAYNPAFPSLDSEEDELEVLASFSGLRIGWSKLVR